MARKKNNDPFDLKTLQKNAMNDSFGISIESSFVQGPSAKQKNNSIRRQKYANARYRQLKSGGTELKSPIEEYNKLQNKNINGVYIE